MSEPNDVTVSSYQGGPSELDTAANDFIKELAAEYKAEPPAVEEAPVATAPPPQENTVTPPPEAPKPEDRGMERLVEREVALRTRESELSAREQRAQAMEERVKQLEAKAIPDDLINRFEYSPEEALTAMGLDPEQVVRQVIANRLGDKADPSVKHTIDNAKIKREINELKARLHEQQRAAAAQAFVAEVQAGAREYVNKGIGENVPTVAAVAKVNPGRVYQEIMEEISRDAGTRAAKDPSGDVLSFPEAAKRVEARWAEFKALVTPANPVPTPASTTSPAAIVPGAKAPSVIKPSDRPIAPWLQRGDLEEDGIKAAMAEFNRSEGTRTR